MYAQLTVCGTAVSLVMFHLENLSLYKKPVLVLMEPFGLPIRS